MSDLEAILVRLERIEAKLPDSSPWIRGDQEAAKYAGYQSKKSFVAWAKASGIKPSKSDGLNFWSRREIDKARERGQR